MTNFQRDGSRNNADVGQAFEKRASEVLAEHGLRLKSPHNVPCGLGAAGLDTERKRHAFDLGSENPKVIVECKSHTWTRSGKVPSAKMTNWVAAMFYFHLAPSDYRKIFFVERSVHRGREESLMCYFLRTHAHVIPKEVEFWELGDELIVRNKGGG